MRASIFSGLLLVGAAYGIIACGKSESDPAAATSTSTSATGGGGATGGTGGAGGEDTTAVCVKACSDLYTCGLELDAAMVQLCPGFTGGDEKETFLHGDPMVADDGCVPSCGDQPLLAGIVDPTDCAGTVTGLKGLNDQFKDTCENGIGGGAGGAGGAGATGSGGAGGAGTGGAGGQGG